MSDNYYDRRSPEYAGNRYEQPSGCDGVLIIPPEDYWMYLPRAQRERIIEERKWRAEAQERKDSSCQQK